MPHPPHSGGAIPKLILIFALAGAALCGCTPEEPVRIGFLAGITGRAADMGMSGRNAVQLAVEQCNARGGIRGRRVKLIVKNDQHHAEIAVKAVQELIVADVAAIVGPMTSSMAVATVPYLNRSRVVAVAPTVTTPRLSGLDDSFFRVCITADEHAYRSARYQLRSGDMRRVAVAYDVSNRVFSENWLTDFKKTFLEGGGEILIAIEFKTEGGHSFAEVARELLAPAPDGVLIIANPMDSALLCQQIRKSSPAMKITLSNWGVSQRFIEMAGKAAEGVTTALAFDWDSPSPSYRAFRKSYIERYQREPGFAGVYAYDAARVVLTALNDRKPGQSLKSAILSIGRFDGLQHDIHLDAYGDVEPIDTVIKIVRNRKFVLVE